MSINNTIENPFESNQPALFIHGSSNNPVIVRNGDFEVITVGAEDYENAIDDDSRINILGQNAAKAEAMKRTVAKVLAMVIVGGILAYAVYTSGILNLSGRYAATLGSILKDYRGIILSIALVGTFAGIAIATDSLDRITTIGSRALNIGLNVASATATATLDYVLTPAFEVTVSAGSIMASRAFDTAVRTIQEIPNATDRTTRVLARGVGYTASTISTLSEGIRQLSVDHPRAVGGTVGLSILLTSGTYMLTASPAVIEKLPELLNLSTQLG